MFSTPTRDDKLIRTSDHFSVFKKKVNEELRFVKEGTKICHKCAQKHARGREPSGSDLVSVCSHIGSSEVGL